MNRSVCQAGKDNLNGTTELPAAAQEYDLALLSKLPSVADIGLCQPPRHDPAQEAVQPLPREAARARLRVKENDMLRM